jgi:hypothetical protein
LLLDKHAPPSPPDLQPVSIFVWEFTRVYIWNNNSNLIWYNAH